MQRVGQRHRARAAQLAREVRHQQRDVLGPLAQRGQHRGGSPPAGSRGPRGSGPARPRATATGWWRPRCARRPAGPGSSPPAAPRGAPARAAAWAADRAGSSPTSSRNRVPPSAASKAPARSLMAPVKAPLTCPNSSLSIRLGDTAEQSNTTKGPPLRWLSSCRPSATSSLPVPVSPSTSRVVSVGATRSRMANTRRMAALRAEQPAEPIARRDGHLDHVGQHAQAQRRGAGLDARVGAGKGVADGQPVEQGAVGAAGVDHPDAFALHPHGEVVPAHRGIAQGADRNPARCPPAPRARAARRAGRNPGRPESRCGPCARRAWPAWPASSRASSRVGPWG